MNKKVSYARTHQGIYAPAVGELGTTFPPLNKTLDNLAMAADDVGLTLTFSYKGLKHELLVPMANVVVLSVHSEDKIRPVKVVV